MSALALFVALSLNVVAVPRAGSPPPRPGPEWTPRIDRRGDAEVAMRYAYDRLTLWALSLTPDPSTDVARAADRPLRWRLYDEPTGHVYQEWTAARRDDAGATVFELRRVNDVRALLPRLTTAVLVVADQRGGPPLAHVALRSICETHGQAVTDLTNLYGAPCAVPVAALPVINPVCAAASKRIDQALLAKRLTCNAANDQLGALGCDYLMCP